MTLLVHRYSLVTSLFLQQSVMDVKSITFSFQSRSSISAASSGPILGWRRKRRPRRPPTQPQLCQSPRGEGPYGCVGFGPRRRTHLQYDQYFLHDPQQQQQRRGRERSSRGPPVSRCWRGRVDDLSSRDGRATSSSSTTTSDAVANWPSFSTSSRTRSPLDRGTSVVPNFRRIYRPQQQQPQQ